MHTATGSPAIDSLTQNTPIYRAENGLRVRRLPASIPGNSNLFKACIHGDQTVVTGSTVRMRLLQDVTISGMKIPANTLFYGVATLGANRLDIVVSNLKVGDNLNPVSVVVFDNDAMEGLNLPNNLKANAAKRMEQGLVTEHRYAIVFHRHNGQRSDQCGKRHHPDSQANPEHEPFTSEGTSQVQLLRCISRKKARNRNSAGRPYKRSYRSSMSRWSRRKRIRKIIPFKH